MKSAEIFRIITEWLLLFFPKFRRHLVKNEKVVTENLSQLNAPVLMMEPPYFKPKMNFQSK